MARFAGEPEYGWTFACSAPKSSFARAITRRLDIVDVSLPS